MVKLWLMALPLLLESLTGCAGHANPAKGPDPACSHLAQTIVQQEAAFVARAKYIRQQHILLQEYDREMIAAIVQRREALLSTSLTALPMSEQVAGCTGIGLDRLRHEAHEEMSSLQSYLMTFQRALKWDPEGVFIDARP